MTSSLGTLVLVLVAAAAAGPPHLTTAERVRDRLGIAVYIMLLLPFTTVYSIVFGVYTEI
jgi:hypothetical protein